MVSLEFHWHNPSGRTVALGSTQPLTEMRKWVPEIFDWGGGKGGRCVLSWNLGASTSWNPLDLSRPVMGLIFALGCTVVRYFKWCEMSPCLASKLTQCRTTVSRSWWLSHVRSQLNSGNSSYGINYCFYSSLAHCTDQLVLNWIRQIIFFIFCQSRNWSTNKRPYKTGLN